MPDAVNSQIIDSMLATNTSVLANAPSQSQSVTLEAAAYSISLLMINAVSNQYSASQIANASVVSTCTGILKASAG
jgi:membrane peptidoglycan carboxypeptidase